MSKKPTSPPPAYFLSLSLENVRSFGEKQTISFAREDGRPAQWTIILGDNGVGKTTVLKALAALMPVDDTMDDSENLRPAYVERPKNTWIPIRNSIQNIRFDELKLIGIPNQIRNNPDLKVSSFTSRLVIGRRITVSNELFAPHTVNCNLLLPFFNNQSLGSQWKTMSIQIAGAICYGYGAGRTTGNSTLSDTPENTDTCSSLFDDRANLLNPEEWFLQLDYSSYKEKGSVRKAALNLERVRQALLQVLPDVTDIQIKTTDKQQQQLELLTPYGWVRLRDMSLGYQTLVVWLTDFASKLFIRYPDSDNPLEEPAIVLIDEIDLHLHPSWQRKLIGFLSGIFKNTQFIATAHSPLVVQAAGDAGANVVLLKREGDQTVVQQNLEDVRGWRLDQILTSELFGLDTARSLETERKLQRRAELLSKPKQTAAEKKELAKLTQDLDAEPLGETPSEREVNAVLQELRQRLLKKDSNASAV